MNFDIVAGIHYPHRLAQGKTATEVAEWLAANDYVRISTRQIGLATSEVTVVPRHIYDRRADLH
ncbi:MAG TPA: hypothetical protein VIN03_11825 [Roseateles sp.]